MAKTLEEIEKTLAQAYAWRSVEGLCEVVRDLIGYIKHSEQVLDEFDIEEMSEEDRIKYDDQIISLYEMAQEGKVAAYNKDGFLILDPVTEEQYREALLRRADRHVEHDWNP